MRILIVEDEVHLALALQAIMVKNKYTVDMVHDGENGLDYALSGVYDVILLDIMLPKMNGIDILKEIRKANIITPILLLTAKDEVSDKVRGLDHGADDYLTKPFSTEELLARVRAISRRKGEILEDILKFSDISLNQKNYEISCETRAIKLSLKEFQITEMLFKNSNQIITKEQIIEKVWGFDKDTEYNNVEVYVSFLRKKFQYLNTKVQIKTVRGIGYILEENT